MRLRQIQERQCIDVADGDADVIALAMQSGMACVQLLSIRQGQIIGSNAYFPRVPIHSTAEEIISAFIMQHYLAHMAESGNIPKQIIVDHAVPDRELLVNVLDR